MFKEIEKAIERIYVSKDKNFFISCCKKKIDFLDELLFILKDKCLKFILFDDFPDDPCIEIHFDVDYFIYDNFSIKYISVLKINKIVDFFYLQHEFSIENPDPNGISDLDGFGDEAYNKLQLTLDNIICQYLNSKYYKRLSYANMEEVIPELKMPDNNIFGTQMTVENALFIDPWEICLLN